MKCNQNRETSIRSPGFSLLNTHRLSVFGSILNHNLWSLEESQYMRVSKKNLNHRKVRNLSDSLLREDGRIFIQGNLK